METNQEKMNKDSKIATGADSRYHNNENMQLSCLELTPVLDIAPMSNDIGISRLGDKEQDTFLREMPYTTLQPTIGREIKHTSQERGCKKTISLSGELTIDAGDFAQELVSRSGEVNIAALFCIERKPAEKSSEDGIKLGSVGDEAIFQISGSLSATAATGQLKTKREDLKQTKECEKIQTERNELHDKQNITECTRSSVQSSDPRSASRTFTESEHTCRICYGADDTESCITPCHCSGTTACVHPTCLQKWIETSNTYRCEICRFNYDVRRVLKPVSQWRVCCAPRRCFEAILIAFAMVIPPMVIGAIIWAQFLQRPISAGGVREAEPKDEAVTGQTPLESSSLASRIFHYSAIISLLAASCTSYIVALMYLIKRCGFLRRTWLDRNQKITVSMGPVNVVVEPDNTESTVVYRDDLEMVNRMMTLGLY